MIILDTNVLSETMRSKPNPSVIAWLDRQSVESIWTTSITVFEVIFGIEKLPDPVRRRELEALFLSCLEEGLGQRILSFDTECAHNAARLAAKRAKAGCVVELRDTMIAGIALSYRATIATRNKKHFSDLDVEVIDPWVLS